MIVPLCPETTDAIQRNNLRSRTAQQPHLDVLVGGSVRSRRLLLRAGLVLLEPALRISSHVTRARKRRRGRANKKPSAAHFKSSAQFKSSTRTLPNLLSRLGTGWRPCSCRRHTRQHRLRV
eukprot:2163077-Rhodomonas_salina.2